MDSKAEVLRDVCAALKPGDSSSAKAILKAHYPFEPVEKSARSYNVGRSVNQFLRDGFIDRYTGKRLINPGVLRLLHVVLGDDFPAHPNGKFSQTHIAFWELFPTVDHRVPVSRGGKDVQSNWVTTSMLSNQIKAQWTLKELGWELHPRGAIEEWDGQSRWLVKYLAANPTVLTEASESDHKYIQKWFIATNKALAAGDQSGIW